MEEVTLSAYDDNSDKQIQRHRLRQEILAIRRDLPAPYRAHKSAVLCEQLCESLDYTLALAETPKEDCVVAVYSAFEDEVQLHDFIEGIFERGVRVAFPVMVYDAEGLEGCCEQTMEMHEVSREAYEKNLVPFINKPLKTFGHDCEELKGFPFLSADQLTMITVPVVAFDKNRNRLGYGGGNYDRYLSQISSDCRMVGVAFSEQEVDAIPTESYDIPLTILSV